MIVGGGAGRPVVMPSPGAGGGVAGGPVVMPSPGGGGVVGGGVAGGPVVLPSPGAGGGGAIGGNGGACCGVNCGGAGVGCGGAGCGTGCGGGYDETGVLSFVGQGQGDYRAQTSYVYVGKGAGDVEMVVVPTNVRANWCYCLVIVPLILLLLWLILPMLSSDTTTTTIFIPIPEGQDMPKLVKSCSVYGDPHAMTFDGLHSDYYTTGEFWIVKSADVLIQGKYSPTHATNGLAVTKQIAISGSFLNHHTLIIGEEHATWDGTAILGTFPSQFKDPEGLVTIDYNAQGELLQPGREGKDLHVLHVTLPGQVSLQINRWNEVGEGLYINSKITMPPKVRQDGQCGNFNGNPADDARLAVKARLGMNGVAAEDLLFPGPKTPVDQGIESCTDANLVHAHEQCKQVTKSFWPSMDCLKTVCNGGSATAPMVVQ